MKILQVLGGSSSSGGGAGGVAITSLTGSNAIASGQTALSTSAALLVPTRTARRLVHIKNLDTAETVYVGPSGVTSANGFPLSPGEFVILETKADVYAVAGSGTPTAAFIEQFDS